MKKAILYKEWIKIKKYYLMMFFLSIVVLLNIFLNLKHDFKMTDRAVIWYNVIINEYRFFYSFLYIPLIMGVILSLSQFIPEILQHRLKLTLHLPLNEDKALLQMNAVGLLFLSFLFIFSFVTLWVILQLFFPAEVTIAVLKTTIPWFIAGYTAYLGLAMIIVEVSWIRRVLLIIISFGFIDTILIESGYNIYMPSLFYFIILASFFITAVLLSGHKFRQGAV
jgi:hypothetical protein